MEPPRGVGSPARGRGVCTEVDADERESSKVVKNPFSRFSDAPAAAACVQRDGYNGLQGCCSKGDDLVASLDAVRA